MQQKSIAYGENTNRVGTESTRRDLIAMRVKHGADTPIGHRCSNLIEQIETYQWATAPGTVCSWPTETALAALIGQSMADLARLTSQ